MALEKRVTELEIKVAFQERLLATLDEVIVAMRREVDGLERRVKYLETQGGPGAGPGPGDERPPHY